MSSSNCISTIDVNLPLSNPSRDITSKTRKVIVADKPSCFEIGPQSRWELLGILFQAKRAPAWCPCKFCRGIEGIVWNLDFHIVLFEIAEIENVCTDSLRNKWRILCEEYAGLVFPSTEFNHRIPLFFVAPYLHSHALIWVSLGF